jgi:hypothetical protein
MKPTVHLRFAIRDEVIERNPTYNISCPVKVLQQWWTEGENYPIEGNPDGCLGEWIDIPVVELT